MQLAKVVIAGALVQDVQKDCLKVNAYLNMYSRCGYCIRYKTDFATNFTSIHPSLSYTHNSLLPHNETLCCDGRFETVAKSLEARVQTGENVWRTLNLANSKAFGEFLICLKYSYITKLSCITYMLLYSA